MEKLQVHLNSDEIDELSSILLQRAVDHHPQNCYLDVIREALDRGDTVSIQRNDNRG